MVHCPADMSPQDEGEAAAAVPTSRRGTAVADEVVEAKAISIPVPPMERPVSK